MEKDSNNLEWLKSEYIAVETDDEDSIIIAILTPNEIKIADGYRVRMKPIN